MDERLADLRAQLASCQAQLEAGRAELDKRERERGEAAQAAASEGSRLGALLREQEAAGARRQEELFALQEQLRAAADARAAQQEESQRRAAELVRECEREAAERRAVQAKLEGVEERLVDCKMQLAVSQSQLETARAEGERRERERSEAAAVAAAEGVRLAGALREQEGMAAKRLEETQVRRRQISLWFRCFAAGVSVGPFDQLLRFNFDNGILARAKDILRFPSPCDCLPAPQMFL